MRTSEIYVLHFMMLNSDKRQMRATQQQQLSRTGKTDEKKLKQYWMEIVHILLTKRTCRHVYGFVLSMCIHGNRHRTSEQTLTYAAANEI